MIHKQLNELGVMDQIHYVLHDQSNLINYLSFEEQLHLESMAK